MVSLRKLYSETLTYFSKVKDSNRHGDERPYKCDEWEYWFESRPSRSDERRHKCDECEYCCTRNDSLPSQAQAYPQQQMPIQVQLVRVQVW